ncbi:hypothetical protein AMTR_s00071p00079530 [Amborella trichopoda]|uniref:Aminotransferase class V domain-containing protein n=1 Tax=Amborella trichopoda TaxID=13333 RepID=U5DHF4_AMBTC|nr:hypothetical protein AMTR_s00071p00079530 [Amborella trichopoda]
MRCGELDGYDVIFMSPHKFVGGPGTPGILLMSKALYLLSSHPPSTCGGGTVSYVNGFNEEENKAHVLVLRSQLLSITGHILTKR